MTFIQRADSSLRLNVHFHCLVLDGVYVRDERGELCFHEFGTPTAEEVGSVARWTHDRLQHVLERHGRSLEENDDAPDVLGQEQPVLAACYGASVGDRQLLGEASGQRTRKLAHPALEVQKPDELHYHRERNHQGLGNRLLEPEIAANGDAPIQRHTRLGGLLSFYHREAA